MLGSVYGSFHLPPMYEQSLQPFSILLFWTFVRGSIFFWISNHFYQYDYYRGFTIYVKILVKVNPSKAPKQNSENCRLRFIESGHDRLWNVQHLSRPLAPALAVFNSQHQKIGAIDPEGPENINNTNKVTLCNYGSQV